VREDGRIVGGEGWQEKVHNRQELKKLLRTARIVTFCTCQRNGMNEQDNMQKFKVCSSLKIISFFTSITTMLMLHTSGSQTCCYCGTLKNLTNSADPPPQN
jgi:hypothetical protein